MIKEINCEYNGDNIYSVAYVPDDSTKKFPIVIFSHGFFVTHKYFTEYAEKLLEMNIASYLFDFRGGGPNVQSDGSLLYSSVLTEVHDLDTIVSMVQTLDFVDEDNIYLAGHSQGAMVSALLAAKRPDEIKGLFLLSPGFSIPLEMNNEALPPQGLFREHRFGQLSRKYILDARRIIMYDDIIDYKGSVYIYHGKEDKGLPIQYSMDAVDAYENAKLIAVEGEDHNFTINGRRIVQNEMIKIINGERND